MVTYIDSKFAISVYRFKSRHRFIDMSRDIYRLFQIAFYRFSYTFSVCQSILNVGDDISLGEGVCNRSDLTYIYCLYSISYTIYYSSYKWFSTYAPHCTLCTFRYWRVSHAEHEVCAWAFLLSMKAFCMSNENTVSWWRCPAFYLLGALLASSPQH